MQYRKIQDISPGLIAIRKNILGGGAYIQGGLYSGGIIFGGYFVIVSSYQDL